MKLVARLELRGRGDVQVFRVSAPGPEITKEEPDDARIEISLPRADFNDLADADISHWHTAYEHGVVKIGGDPAVLRLLGGVDRQARGARQAQARPLSRARARDRLPKPHPRTERGAMSDNDTHELITDQADREASGAHPYGRYLEEFEVGAVYKHWPAKTVTESDDHLFCLITMNHHPLHLNDVYAGESQQGQNVVVGPLVYSLALGMSVSDVSGKAIANLATEELSHPNPVFHGDTLFCESEVLDVRPSKSKLDRGIVKVHTRVYKQDNTLVAEFKRTVLFPARTRPSRNPAPVADPYATRRPI